MDNNNRKIHIWNTEVCIKNPDDCLKTTFCEFNVFFFGSGWCLMFFFSLASCLKDEMFTGIMYESGQSIIFHQPRFPWNKGISLPKSYLLGESSCVRSQANFTAEKITPLAFYDRKRLNKFCTGPSWREGAHAGCSSVPGCQSWLVNQSTPWRTWRKQALLRAY